jgi:AraC family transcriptional regulator, transcriptional activator FtrA
MSHDVVAILMPGVVLLDLAAPAHVFGECGAPEYTFSLAVPEPGRVPTSSGFDVVVDRDLSALDAAGTVVVPGNRGHVRPDERILAALCRAHRRGARIMSVCTGAFALAHAGLLDGRRAATHWADAARLQEAFPALEVDASVLYVDEGQVLTSAGVAAGIDLCLHVVRRDHGAERAATIARNMVVAPHRDGGQAQFLKRPIELARTDPGAHPPGLQATREWILEHLGEPLTVPRMARHACVSPRTFARRFVEETGTTPAQWLIEQRIRAAQELLEHTDLPVEQVALRSGFGATSALREQLRRRLQVTPTGYRRAFRAAAA